MGTKIDKGHKPCLLYVVHSSAWILKLVETKIKVKYIVPGFKRTPPNTCQQWSHFLPFLRHLLWGPLCNFLSLIWAHLPPFGMNMSWLYFLPAGEPPWWPEFLTNTSLLRIPTILSRRVWMQVLIEYLVLWWWWWWCRIGTKWCPSFSLPTTVFSESARTHNEGQHSPEAAHVLSNRVFYSKKNVCV